MSIVRDGFPGHCSYWWLTVLAGLTGAPTFALSGKNTNNAFKPKGEPPKIPQGTHELLLIPIA